MSATTGDISLDGSGDLAATVTGSMRIALSGSGDIDFFGGGSLETSATRRLRKPSRALSLAARRA